MAKKREEFPKPYKLSDEQWTRVGCKVFELALQMPNLRATAIKLVRLVLAEWTKGGEGD